jgi:hypothetical protein
MTDVDQPGQHFVFGKTEEVGKKENQFLRQNSQGKDLRRMPVLSDALVVFHHEQLSDSSIQARFQGTQKLQLNEINSARLIESVRNLHPSTPRIKFTFVAR